MRLLLVEDEPELAAVVQAGLTASGFVVEWTMTGGDALARLADGGYALVLLDVMLPDTDGWRVCETLRRRRDPVPVLMLTAREGGGAGWKMPEPKPFNSLNPATGFGRNPEMAKKRTADLTAALAARAAGK